MPSFRDQLFAASLKRNSFRASSARDCSFFFALWSNCASAAALLIWLQVATGCQETLMCWETPQIELICLSCEINTYANGEY